MYAPFFFSQGDLNSTKWIHECGDYQVGRRSGLVSAHTVIEYLTTLEDYTTYREDWNGKGMHIFQFNLEVFTSVWLPFMIIKDQQGEHYPWLCSSTDLLATDWQPVKVEGKGLSFPQHIGYDLVKD